MSSSERGAGRTRQFIGVAVGIACLAGGVWGFFRSQEEKVSPKDALAAQKEAQLVEQSLKEHPREPVTVPDPAIPRKSGRGAVAVPGK